MQKNILLVDDELAPNENAPSGNYMWYYAQAIRDKGYSLTEVNSTDGALRKLEIADFDLVVLDIMMPSGGAFTDDETGDGLRTGVLLARRLREQHPDVPVLILTNVENENTMQQLRGEANVKRIFHKPDYPPFDFVDEISTALESNSSR